MKKIGFIDYHIDEFHANKYPGFIRQTGRDFEVHMAWEQRPSPNGKALPEWCTENSVNPASSIENLVDECDAIIVLAPSNPELHEKLSEIPLRSGKPVYVDKPFAQDLAMARRLVELAQKNNTPLMSSSALRFVPALQTAVNETYKGINASFAVTQATVKSFWEYSIHQLEMLVMLMGTGAERLMQLGNKDNINILIDYPDERRACIIQNIVFPGQNIGQPRCISAFYKDKDPVVIENTDGFWENFTSALLDFFETSQVSIPTEQTLEVMSLVETGIIAIEKPDVWLEIEK